MKRLLVLVLILFIIFVTGCWDRIEINQRIFPYSVGLDVDEDTGDDDNLTITFSYPNINALGKDPSSEDKAFLISGKAHNIFEATHNLSTNIQEPIDLKHLKVLAISDKLASNEIEIRQTLDGLIRDFVISKMVNLLVVRGKTKDLLEAKLESARQETTEGSLYSLLRNEQHSTRFTPKTLSKFIEDMDGQGASHMPTGFVQDEELVISGAGIFKEFKLIGYLNEIENRDVAFLNQEVVADGLDTDFDGRELSLLVTSTKSKKKLVDSGEEPKVLFSVRVECQVHEYILNTSKNIDSQKILRSMEKTMADKLKKSLKKTIRKLQGDYNADIIGVSGYLDKFHPKLWKQLKDDWETIFPHLDIDVEVDVKIRRRGLTV